MSLSRRFTWSFLSLTLVLVSLGCFRRDGDVNKRVIVKVNDQSLSAKDFAALLTEKLRSLSAFSVQDPKNVDKAKADVIREYIVQIITEDWANEHKIYVTKDEVDSETTKIMGNYGDQVSFRSALVREGLTFVEWQKRLRFSLLEKKVTHEITKAVVKPSEEDLKTYYNENSEEFTTQEEVRLRQIVVETESSAKQVYSALVEKKKKFEDLAKEFSMTPEGAGGGDLGFIRRGTSDVFDRAFNMNVGARSDIIKSPYGYHIFEVTDKRKPQKQSFATVREKIEQEFLNDKQQSAYSQWLEQQIQRTRVFKDQKLVDSITVDLSNS